IIGAGATALARQVPADTPGEQPLTQKQTPAEKPAPEQLFAAARPAEQPAPEKKAPAEQPLPEKKPDQPKEQSVSGVVKSVDDAKCTITITSKDGDKTFPVAPNANTTIDDKPGQLAKIPIGANVNLTLVGDPKTVSHLSAFGADVFAVVKAVDTAKNTIT